MTKSSGQISLNSECLNPWLFLLGCKNSLDVSDLTEDVCEPKYSTPRYLLNVSPLSVFVCVCTCASAELELKREGQLLLKYFETKSTGTLAFISGNSCSPK